MTCPLFVELCAGTAAVSLRLHGGPHARPPVSRMGAKTGYAHAILHALGLRQGQGHADGTRYLLCEPDPGVRLLLHAYTDRALAQAAAAIIRSWKDEDPRALWERLRAEGPAVCPDVGMDAREVAASMWFNVRTMPQAQARGASSGDFLPQFAPSGCRRYSDEAPAQWLDVLPTIPATIRTDARTVDPREVARWAWVAQRAYRQGEPQSGGPVQIGDGGRYAAPLTQSLASIPTLPATIAEDCREVDPREVARLIMLMGHSFRKGDVGSGYQGTEHSKGRDRFLWARQSMDVDTSPTLPATIHDDARTIEPARLPPGTVCYIDPSYVGTTGYANDLGRPEVVKLAQRWADAGALVCVSEAEPIPELVAEGWHTLDITDTRKGQKRTFSKQQREWLTISEAPKWRPSVARGLFSRGEG